MQGTNVLFGQIAVVFGIVIAGVWAATQWTAAALGALLETGPDRHLNRGLRQDGAP